MKIERKKLRKLIKEMFGLSPLALFVGCQGKGGLKHRHFAWSATKDKNFISTWEESDQETYEMQAETGKNFFVVEIKNLESMEEGVSFFQKSQHMFPYEDLQDGQIYDDLEDFENGVHTYLKEDYKYDGTPGTYTLYFEITEEGIMETMPKTYPG